MKKENNIETKYLMILNIIKKGESLSGICSDKHICLKNTRKMLKRFFPDEYDLYVYGKIIKINEGVELRLIPNKQTNRTETNLTKEAKKFLKKEYGCFEEVGVWLDNFKKRYTIDLYSVERDLGIEIFWQSDYNFKKILKRVRIYEKYFGNILCALLRDSSVRSMNRSYILIKEKLKKENINYIIVDIAKGYPITERG